MQRRNGFAPKRDVASAVHGIGIGLVAPNLEMTHATTAV